MTRKTASTAAPLHPLLAERWSPRGLDRTHRLDDAALTALLEAARWAPSAGNSQPWRFLVARRGDAAFGAAAGNTNASLVAPTPPPAGSTTASAGAAVRTRQHA